MIIIERVTHGILVSTTIMFSVIIAIQIIIYIGKNK